MLSSMTWNVDDPDTVHRETDRRGGLPAFRAWADPVGL
jgi:predicted type IV restriction endonuclease